ncbi:YcjX family protein [Roseibium sp.]|uniref:YcjX family protein n=1 Tax=Roseibium sp. TaxID=1936156 RepID=UPI003A9837CC
MLRPLKIADEARLALANLTDAASDLTVPSLRLGVTGLARAGKTVFLSALVHNLMHGGRLPLFQAAASGRLSRATLQPQPDDAVPRFDYEAHIAALVNDRIWPQSTSQTSELRLTLEYESASYLSRKLGPGKLHLDLIDYPGEWLLDLPLLRQTYAEFSSKALRLARADNRAAIAAPFFAALAEVDPESPESDTQAQRLAASFTEYLSACRSETMALSMLPPGRFLMPGELAGSPALTFAPMDFPTDAAPARTGTLRAMMERRFEAYKTHVVRPFFRDHFARLDRQIVLVDVLHALNAGPHALADLQEALNEVLVSFRPGRKSWLSSILSRKIDRILFAATKADHLHRDDHDRLQAILRKLVARGMDHAEYKGAQVDVLALAAVRATREGTVTEAGQELPLILGTPMPGQIMNGEQLSENKEIGLFPGDLPKNPDSLFETLESVSQAGKFATNSSDLYTPDDHSYLRFRPPRLEKGKDGLTLSLPHIRLDRAIEFLIGDRLT